MRNVQFMSITVESTSIGQVPRKFLRTIIEVPVVVLHLVVVSRCSEKFTALPVRGKVRTSHKEGNVTMACITSLNVTRNRSEKTLRSWQRPDACDEIASIWFLSGLGDRRPGH